jgi:hypothetical protein
MADFEHLKEWLRLSDNDKLICFRAITDKYDLKMPAVEKALSDRELYKTIVAHRDRFSHLGGVDYKKHEPKFINIIPPESVLSLWEKDYAEMSESMIYGEKLNFNELIGNLKQVNDKINRIEW